MISHTYGLDTSPVLYRCNITESEHIAVFTPYRLYTGRKGLRESRYGQGRDRSV